MTIRDNFATRSISGIDATLLDFVETKVNSFIKWDLLRFFYEYPYAPGTVENITDYVGRKVTVVKSELENLVENGVIERKLLNGIPIYALATDETVRALVHKFILAYEDRHFRVQAVNQIVPGMR